VIAPAMAKRKMIHPEVIIEGRNVRVCQITDPCGVVWEAW